MRGTRWVRTVALLAVGALALSGCGSKIKSGTSASASHKPCGTVNLADNPWVGYEADVAVISYLATNKLGCTVKKQNINEQVSWQGFASGTVDVILENWGHDDLKKQYIDQQKVAVEDGETGNQGVIGWYIPPWLAQAHPDILDWHNLNKYADEFKTSESGGKGQFLDGDPSYVTNDDALVKNLHLNFKVVYAGSEDALIQAFRTAEEQKKWVIGYFYEPQWFLNEVKLVHIKLPAYTPGCDADAQKVACDYQPFDLDKIVSKKFADSGSPAATLVKNFRWTNTDQNDVARDIAENKMSDDAAAKKWVDAHPDVWQSWLKGT
ncbi:ABC transporter substrate-binding protein [Rugosimonospora africana]|uniref:ABC transporter substrate-binding protein n=1 Tax=Rugosimonospora africana TaxID=556532 RepID=UPI0019405090|nr:ABC transporter substrate-binding protein [Rugosimonospora africana]